MDIRLFSELYRHMRTARRVDELESALAQRGEAHFHLAGSGHETIAALAPHLVADDWLHPHYRDRALILARGVPVERLLHNLLATDLADGRGRRMPPFLADPALHLLSMPTLVGNSALQAAGVAHTVKDQPNRPIVLCGMGDGGSQEGEVLEAIAEAVRSTLPVLFVIEDNRYALSTPTRGRTFYSRPDGEAAEFYGLPIVRVDGRDPAAAHRTFGAVVAGLRADRRPRLLVLEVERLSSHSNADDQTVYRSTEELSRARAEGDPVARLAKDLLAGGLRPVELERINAGIEERLQAAVAAARAAPAPRNSPARKPLPAGADAPTREQRGKKWAGALTLLEALRETLRARLRKDPRTVLYGQDIEDPKGDVFGVTRGLSREFPERVRNAPLSESTIAGVSAGRALAGDHPVAFLQFADFFPLAFNQIQAEIAQMYWRTGGAWEAPVVILSVTGGYRPGLGPYHSQSPEAVFCHVPGLDVFMPSTATDAAGLLNAAFESGRPAVFLYPKNLLNERVNLAPPAVDKLFVPIGRARVVRGGSDLTLVGWGDTVALCEQAAAALAKCGVEAEIVDLRTLSPWDRDTVVASAARTGRLIVAHEDQHTCGLGAEILATVAEAVKTPVQVARIAAPDTLLPYNYACQLDALPSVRRILEAAAPMLDLDLRWEKAEREAPGQVLVRAMGSSPSDETIHVVALHIKPGEEVEEGARLASVEADKASMEITAPVPGTVDAVLARPGDVLRVGTPLIRMSPRSGAVLRTETAVAEEIPILRRRRTRGKAQPAAAPRAAEVPVVLSTITAALGSRKMTNADFLGKFPQWTSDDVLQRTGIERRYWIGQGENVLTLAVRACGELLEREKLSVADLQLIICSTGTPLSMTPSLACSILRELSPETGETMVQAYDVNAACSGYLYALQAAHDFLKNQPDAKILVVTAETLSPVLDPQDAGTLFLFGDAATATLVSREPGRGDHPVRLHRPVLSAVGEDPRTLYVPVPNSGEWLRMDGQRVFRIAVRKMIQVLELASREAGVDVGDLAMIVPHQANTRIIEAIRQKIKVPPEKMFDHLQSYGNTSSNTIPMALREVLSAQPRGARLGLCAFGGGFTFGAAILDVL